MSGTYPLAPTMINLLYRGIHQGGKCTPFSSQYRARCLLPHLAGYGFLPMESSALRNFALVYYSDLIRPHVAASFPFKSIVRGRPGPPSLILSPVIST